MPWKLYYTFVLEEKHGFNKMVIITFSLLSISSIQHLVGCVLRLETLMQFTLVRKEFLQSLQSVLSTKN